MIIIMGDRQKGKTTELIKIANKEDLGIIITDSLRAAQNIEEMAKNMGCNVTAISISQYDPIKHRGNIYVDNAEWVLRILLKASVEGMTINSNDGSHVKILS